MIFPLKNINKKRIQNFLLHSVEKNLASTSARTFVLRNSRWSRFVLIQQTKCQANKMFMISLSVTLNYDISCIFCRVVCSLPNFIGCAICASASNWKRTPNKGYVLKLMPEVRLGVLTAEQSNTTRAHPKQKNSQTKITTVSDIKWGSTMLHTPLRLAIFFCINKSQSFMIR